MEKYNMRANFYPMKDPQNRFLGNADLFISDVIRLRGIAVFQNAEGTGHNIQFPSYTVPTEKGDQRMSYVLPESKEAFAQMLDVIEKAIASEKHFAYSNGVKKVDLSVKGHAVEEPHADARFSLKVGDICTVRGLSTQEVPLQEKEGTFISVRVPNLPPYEKNGEKVYPPIMEGLKSTYEKDGKTMTTDFGQVIQAMVRAERNKCLGIEKPPLGDKVNEAAQKAGAAAVGKETPGKEAER